MSTIEINRSAIDMKRTTIDMDRATIDMNGSRRLPWIERTLDMVGMVMMGVSRLSVAP